MNQSDELWGNPFEWTTSSNEWYILFSSENVFDHVLCVINILKLLALQVKQLAAAVEYTDYFSAEG